MTQQPDSQPTATTTASSTPTHWLDRLYEGVFNDKLRHRFEQAILWLSVTGFLIHLAMIELHRLELLPLVLKDNSLLMDPITALYTPFSFILIYEVYLLIYYLPGSFSRSVAKQYEVISLIVARRIFKDINKIKLEGNWFSYEYNRVLTADMLGLLFIFLLIGVFYYLQRKAPKLNLQSASARFIRFKKAMAVLLVVIFLGTCAYSFGYWGWDAYRFSTGQITETYDLNAIFYHEFFTILILVDVLLLLFSFQYTENYSQLMRNTGFVISTILIRLSFSAEGVLNTVLVVASVLFGLAIQAIYNLKLEAQPKAQPAEAAQQ